MATNAAVLVEWIAVRKSVQFQYCVRKKILKTSLLIAIKQLADLSFCPTQVANGENKCHCLLYTLHTRRSVKLTTYNKIKGRAKCLWWLECGDKFYGMQLLMTYDGISNLLHIMHSEYNFRIGSTIRWCFHIIYNSEITIPHN